ncbi:class I SAM-dependent methyltransferase [Paenibacillus sp. P96]|uniref:Class I SAM-dependent methyltransferase n=1 Tax=Paenibacillus zeirhizosphaerae TaxID=2987519 RepID=A0ABT9FXU4_9BACL|nr:class I SAM-dependent methyltransferase [Paenibacillus sp. P96]MDP4099341.1 class I SAM-dependent methyltransferase [Paenibacillus sp. P96]
MNEWKFYDALFECDQVDIRIKNQSAWAGHRQFAYDLVRFLKPKIIVELGTHWGASFFSFCQAIKDEGYEAQCYGVDTWQGDGHSGSYDSTVYETIQRAVSQLYQKEAVPVRSLFDDALDRFADESIDLLHIDGFHSYEAVSHDYETWLPKVADNGIVLFHDISARYYGFGVYKLWEELKERYPSAEFEHSSGLGILMPKGYDSRMETIVRNWDQLKPHYVS